MPTQPIFRPRLLDCLRGYTRSDFRSDFTAGLTLGVIALSLSMALGIASGATPAVRIITGIVAGFLISLLGGSRVTIGGPTAAFIPVVAQEHGTDNLIICTQLRDFLSRNHAVDRGQAKRRGAENAEGGKADAERPSH